jgi:hypothetical protein
MSELKHQLMLNKDMSYVPCYLKAEADKVIAALKSDNADLRDDKKLTDAILDERNAEIAELQKQVHDYAQGLYVIQAKAEKELRHHKYKRCLLRSVIAEMNATHFKDLFYGAGSEELADEYNKQITIHYKYKSLWLALADKFKDK